MYVSRKKNPSSIISKKNPWIDNMASKASPLVSKLSDFPWKKTGIWTCNRSLCKLFYCTVSGSEINFFQKAPTGNWIFFFSRHMEKCGGQKVSIKFFLCSETQTKILGRHRLASKIFAIDVIRNQTIGEIIFWPWQIYISTFWRPENI